MTTNTKSFSRAWLSASTLSMLIIQTSGAFADEVSQTAYASFDAGRYKEAYPLFMRMVNRDPSDLRAQYYLALVCQRTGQIHNAIKIYVQIVSRAPNSNEGRYSKAALNILAHRKKITPNIPPAAPMPPPGGSRSGSSSNSSSGSNGSNGSNGSGKSDSNSANASAVGKAPDRDMQAAQNQSAELLSNAKRQADALDVKADAIEKDMASVMRPKGTGPAYTKADIDAETADLRRQSVEIRARGQRESDDVLRRAKLRQEASSHH